MASTSTPTSSVNPALKDPLLAPFLGASFSSTKYINELLPAPTAFSNTSPTLPPLHSTASQTLTSLTHHQTKLLSSLSQTSQTLTRLTPRLHYETQVLSSHVSSLASALPTTTLLQPPPPALDTLRSLAQVRTKLEDVQRVFDKAMRLLNDDGAVLEEVRFALVEDGEERARSILEEWRGVATVFQGTVEEAKVKKLLEDVEKLMDEETGRGKEKDPAKPAARQDSTPYGSGNKFSGIIGGWGIGRR